MKKCIAGILLILSLISARSQNPQVIPPSPVSQEFAKYVTHEVSLYNGIPNITIPLHTIQLKGLTIPVSLSYHASGIKFGQNDGDVGVGWVINPGYRISRTIHGYADELETMPSNILATINDLETNGDEIARDGFLSEFVPYVDLDFGSNYNGRSDGEFDQFVFSVPNASGEFIITDRVNKTASTIEESNLRIDYKGGQSPCADLYDFSIVGLQIIDDAGNKYSFGDYNIQSECNIETTSPLYGGYVATAWGLSEIVTPTGEEVKFNYERRSAWNKAAYHIRNYTVRETNIQKCEIETITPFEGGDVYTSPGHETFYTEEIITPNEQIIFQYNEDAPYDLYPKKLNNIQVKTSNGNILKTIEFFYSENYNQTMHYVFLDHVTIYDGEHNEVETYRFDYYAPNTTAAFTCDQYGYYKETSSPVSYYHQEFLDDPILVNEEDPTGDNCDFYHGTMSHYLSGQGISREPSFVPNYYSLKRITYPTGGYTNYEYEHGRYGVEGSVKNAGIRVKTIKSSDLITQESIVRSYTYGNNQNDIENGIGNFEVWVTPDLFVNEKVEMLYWCDYSDITGLPSWCANFAQRIITYSTTIQGDIGAALSQSGVAKYPYVTEYYSKYVPSNGYPLSEMSGGKTVYYFNTGNLFDVHGLSAVTEIPREEYHGTNSSYIDKYSLWDKPRLDRKIVFSLTGGQYIPLQESVFEYQQTSHSLTGFKVVQSVVRPNDIIENDDYSAFDGGVSRYFNYGGYTMEIGKNVLKRKIEYQYLNGDTISTEHSFDYNNLLVSRETIKRSTGDDLVNYTTYPLDYASGTTFIDDMKNNRLLKYPVEQVSYLDNGINQTILSGIINQYKPGGKGLLDTQWSLETDSAVSLGSFKFSNRSVGILPPSGSQTSFLKDSRYARKITYDAYDNKTNILQHHKENDVNVSYVWSYNRTYPIAKIENADYSIVETVLGGSVAVEAFGDKTNPTDAEVKAFLAPLFTDSRLARAMVSTYTYKPLTGMTSQTDVSGQTTYYEYDPYGRLIRIKDNDLNILKEYKYHYGHN